MKLLLRRLLVVLLSAVIAGCVADRLHREGMNELNQGEFEDGLTKLAAAVKSDPNNLTYRLDFRARKEAAVQQLISAGDSAHAAGKPEEAENNYRRVLVIERGNVVHRAASAELLKDHATLGRLIGLKVG